MSALERLGVAGMPSFGLDDDYPQLWDIVGQLAMREGLGTPSSPMQIEMVGVLRELWRARRDHNRAEVMADGFLYGHAFVDGKGRRVDPATVRDSASPDGRAVFCPSEILPVAETWTP